jgi:hypothetical protein
MQSPALLQDQTVRQAGSHLAGARSTAAALTSRPMTPIGHPVDAGMSVNAHEDHAVAI